MPSVPNTIGRAATYDELRDARRGAALGDDLVVQTPYGDSGKTTFFVKRPARLGPPRRTTSSARS